MNPCDVSQVSAFALNESENHEEEDSALIAWDLEWWNKKGAAIIH